MLGGAAGRLKSMIVEAGIVPRCVVQDLSRVARSSDFAMSLVDLEESYDLGVSAHMRSAKPEFTGQVVGIRRGQGVDGGYNTEFFACPASDLANFVRPFPSEWILPNYQGVSDEALDYMHAPLIQGEPKLICENGIPLTSAPLQQALAGEDLQTIGRHGRGREDEPRKRQALNAETPRRSPRWTAPPFLEWGWRFVEGCRAFPSVGASKASRRYSAAANAFAIGRERLHGGDSVRSNSSSRAHPRRVGAAAPMTSRFTPAAKRLSLNVLLERLHVEVHDGLARAHDDRLRRSSPVSSSVAKSTFSICSSGSGRLGLKSLLCVWMARMSSGDPPAAAISSAAYTVLVLRGRRHALPSQGRAARSRRCPEGARSRASNSRAKWRIGLLDRLAVLDMERVLVVDLQQIESRLAGDTGIKGCHCMLLSSLEPMLSQQHSTRPCA